MRSVAEHWALTSEPERAERYLREHVFDHDLASYLRMLVLSGALAALFQVISTLGFALYTAYRSSGTIEWWQLANVSAALGVGAFFLMLFSGTVVLFIIALVLHVSIRRKLVEVMHALVLAASPFVLYAWFPILLPGAVVWTGTRAVRLLKSRTRRAEVLARE